MRIAQVRKDRLDRFVPPARWRLLAPAVATSGWYETAVTGVPPDTTSRTEKIAYVAGSGRRGRSYLYWSNGRLYQLPTSYWRNVGWINSPGNAYVDGRVNFERQIAPRCMDCHSTWIDWVPDPGTANRFGPEGAILGITCERCHGSGVAHVASERSALRVVRRAPMVNPATQRSKEHPPVETRR